MPTKRVIDFKAIDLNQPQNSNTSNSLPSAIRLSSPNQNLPLPTLNYVRPFGSERDLIYRYPNDVIQLDVYNAVDQYLETNYRVSGYTRASNTVTVDIEADLSRLGYLSGRYKVYYKLYRNYLGSGDGHKLQVQEISADRLEVRVIPTVSSVYNNDSFLNTFQAGFFQLPKAEVLANLFLNKSATNSVRVFDYVQDRFTFPSTPYSIIFKLASPLPTDVVLGDLMWLNQLLSDVIEDDVVIIPPKPVRNTTQIAGPNWDIFTKEQTSISTKYKDWDDLLSTNVQTSQEIITKLFSSSFIEGIPLNIDYRSFENFVHFGSLTERLHNFRYKMQLLEQYDDRIAALTTDLNGFPSSSVTSSVYFQSNVIEAQTKRAALLGSFDGYEKYLYYESSSYVTNSYGEFFPDTWPKVNNNKPYTNYPVTSSQVEDWFEGIISSASLFDQNNNNALYRLIPAHVLEDDVNDSYLLFVNMIGHYFDLMFAYIKQMTLIHNRDQSILEGFSKELIYHIAKNLGLDFENGNAIDELWSYLLGTEIDGSTASSFGISTEDKTKETWKRIVNNLPYLLKTKGTDRGLRALITCFGIPRTILRIREYGGAEPDFDTKTDYVHDRFNYALYVGNGGEVHNYYYGFGLYATASYGLRDLSELIKVPWKPLENDLMPMAIQLRVKMIKNETEDKCIMEVPNQWKIKTSIDNNGYKYIGFYLSGSSGWATASVSSSIYDGVFHSITLQRLVDDDTPTINQTYTLVVKRTNYEKVVSTQTASLYIDGSTSSSYNSTFISTGSLWIPGSGSFVSSQSSYVYDTASFYDSSSIYDSGGPTASLESLLTGSIQEFRYWKTSLEDSILNNQALAPNNYQGNPPIGFTGSTSSFYDLSFRLCLGADNRKIHFGLTRSFASQHPDQTSIYFGDNTTYKRAEFFRFREPLYEPIVEVHSLEWPDVGGNRSISNKIRIDENFLAGQAQLYPDIKVEKSLLDNYPIDSPRLGVYFSPTNETNQDIAEQFGGLSLDDFIGDPSHIQLDHYPDLEILNREYFKKYQKKGAVQNYIRLLKHYDAALFKLIKKFIPYRADGQVGLVIEPHLLHRSKVPTKKPTIELLHYSASIILPRNNAVIGGNVLDGGDGGNTVGGDSGTTANDGSSTVGGAAAQRRIPPSTTEPLTDTQALRSDPSYRSGYVPEGVFVKPINLSGEQQQVAEYNDIIYYPEGRQFEANRSGINISRMLGDRLEAEFYEISIIDGTTNAINMISLSGSANEYNGIGIADLPSLNDSLTGDINTGVTSYGRNVRVDGSQYVFMTYATSGSGPTRSEPYWITSSRYDYHEAQGPVILDGHRSSFSNRSEDAFDINLYGKKAFRSGSLINFYSASNIQDSDWTLHYGLVFNTTTVNGNIVDTYNDTQYWSLSSGSGLQFRIMGAQGLVNAQAKVPAFFYKQDDPSTHNLLYRIKYNISSSVDNVGDPFPSMSLRAGDYTAGLVAVITGSSTATRIVKATGPYLTFECSASLFISGAASRILDLEVECLNYRSQTQDFHLNDSYGMRNARYDGCKMTSPDWNVDSDDTIDKGPVVQITLGGGAELITSPSPRGTFKVL